MISRIFHFRSIYENKAEKIASVKDVFKWSVGSMFTELLKVPFVTRVKCTLYIISHYDHNKLLKAASTFHPTARL